MSAEQIKRIETLIDGRLQTLKAKGLSPDSPEYQAEVAELSSMLDVLDTERAKLDESRPREKQEELPVDKPVDKSFLRGAWDEAKSIAAIPAMMGTQAVSGLAGIGGALEGIIPITGGSPVMTGVLAASRLPWMSSSDVSRAAERGAGVTRNVQQIGRKYLPEIVPDSYTAKLLGGLGSAISTSEGISGGLGSLLSGRGLKESIATGAKVYQEGLGNVMGDAAFEATGSPFAATAAMMAPELIEQLLPTKIAAAGRVERLMGTPVDAATAKRIETFKEAGVPEPVRAMVTRTPEDIAEALRLSSMPTGAAKDPLDFKRAEMDRGFADAFQQAIDELNTEQLTKREIGQGIKKELKATKAEELRKIKEAYESYEGADIPLMASNIVGAIDSKRFQDAFAGIPEKMKKTISDKLVEHGVNIDPDAIKSYLGRKVIPGIEHARTEANIRPLTLKSHDDLVHSLNAIYDPANEALTKVLNPLLGAIKDEAKRADDALEYMVSKGSQGKSDIDYIQMAKGLKDEGLDLKSLLKARKMYAQYSNDWGKAGFVGRLLRSKGFNPDEDIIKPSAVMRKLQSEEFGAVENVEKLFAKLETTTEGQKLIDATQSTYLMKIMDDAVQKSKGRLRTASGEGEYQFDVAKMIKAIDKIGKDKLEAVFYDKPRVVERLNKIRQAGEYTLDDVNFVMDSIKGLPIGRVIGGAAGSAFGKPLIGSQIGDTVDKNTVKMSKKQIRKAVKRQMDISDLVKGQYKQFYNTYPSLAGFLGVEALLLEDEITDNE